MIDQYIDEYWNRKKPERLSVNETNQIVRKLFHEILIKEKSSTPKSSRDDIEDNPSRSNEVSQSNLVTDKQFKSEIDYNFSSEWDIYNTES